MDSNEDVISRSLEFSSNLLESLSDKDSVFHRLIIRSHIEVALNNYSMKQIKIDFYPGLEWVNVNEPLTLQTSKIKVLDFFTYCCVNCMHVFPQLKELERKFTIEDGVLVIGVHTPKFSNEKDTTNLKAAVRRYEITHPVVNDCDERLWKAFGISCWPTLVILGPQNELVLYLMGETHKDVLQMAVEEAHLIFSERKWLHNDLPRQVIIEDIPAPEKQLLSFPGKVAVAESSSGRWIAVADTGHHRVVVTDSSARIQHIVGCGKSGLKDGGFTNAQFHSPQGLVFADPSTLYVADTENHAIRKVDLAGGTVETVVGDGSQGQDQTGGKIGVAQQISSPWDLVVLNSDAILIAMAGTHQIWAYFINDAVLWKKQYAAGTCVAVAGSGREENRNNSYPLKAGFAQPSGLTVAGDGQMVYVADSESSTVRTIGVVDGRVSGIVGGLPDPLNLFAFGDVDGKGQDVKLQHPLGVAWSDHKQALYVCDSYNHKLKIISPSTKECSVASSHLFNEPGGLCAIGNLLYIADTNNHCIKTVNLDDMTVETLSILSKGVEVKSKNSELPLKEVHAIINAGGGQMELSASISVSDGIKPLPESPAEWTLSLPDGWKEIKTESQRSLVKSWTLEVPAVESMRSCQLKLQCQLFYCHNNMCSRRTLPFLVTVAFNDTAPKSVSCTIHFLFTL